jgi:hypothetical protein
MQFFKALIAIALVALLGACDQNSLPRYWLCQGSTQQVFTATNQTQEKYSGSDPVLLELFQGHVYQFFSPALAGSFVQCPSQQGDSLIFRMNDCQQKGGQSYFREGTLNQKSGTLVFSEFRQMSEHTILGSGQYQCQFIGSTYSFTPFNHANTAR